MRPGYVYVASSWRNPMFDATVAILKAAGIPLYDFKNPEPNTGFGWTEVMPSFDINRQICDRDEYLTALEHPRSIEGFDSDFAAMNKADTFVLVLPCGRSAHLELGWAVGAGKRTAILLDGPQVTPELMYKMVDYIAPTVFDLLGWLGVDDDDEAPAPAASSPASQAVTGTVADPAAAAPVARTVTPDQKNADGSTTMKVQRCCNGCGNPVGDVTLAEIDCAITGAPLPDVRSECPRCSASAAGDAS